VFSVNTFVYIFGNQAIFHNVSNFYDDGSNNTGCNFPCPNQNCSDCSFLASDTTTAPGVKCCDINTCNGHGFCSFEVCTCTNNNFNDSKCSICNNQFDIAINCTDCLTGFFGFNCSGVCNNCNGHGACLGGINGTGDCQCQPHFNTTINCADCDTDRYSFDCSQICNSADCNVPYGKCLDGMDGTGLCTCVNNFNSTLNCSDCNFEFYGNTCLSLCNVTCNNHGVCSAGINGTGMCICDPGFEPAVNCESQPTSNPPIGMIVGIVFGSLVGLILLVALGVFAKRRYDRSKYEYVKEKGDD